MNPLTKALFGIRSIGLANTMRIQYASLVRTWQEWRYRTPSRPSQLPLPPGELVLEGTEPRGGGFTYQNTRLEVCFLASDLVRLSWEPGEPPLPYAIASHQWPAVPLAHNQIQQGWSIASEDLEVIVGADGSVRFRDRQGRILRQDLPPQRNGSAWTLRTRLRPQEQLHGLGERASSFNLQPGSYRLVNRDPGGAYPAGADPLYISIPVYLGRHSDGAYLAFYENTHEGLFELADDPTESLKTCQVSFTGGMLRYYFIPGPPSRALERYTQLTGRPPMPPRWALGYHQSRWGYKSETDVRAVAAGFQEHDLPLSAIHLDIDYMQDYQVFSVDPNRFPDLAGLAEDFAAKDIRLVAILDPGVKRDPDNPLYQEGRERGTFCKLPDGKIVHGRVWPGWCAFPDFSDPQARAWWGDQYPQLLNLGIAGIWHDMNEPSIFVAWGQPTLPSSTQYAMEGRGGNHQEANNVYGLLMNMTGFEALQDQHPSRRPWLLTRSGWAGVQRYAWSWTGDIESTWSALQQTLPTVLGLGLSGLPLTGPDIGGFSGNPSAELFLRWFQLAAFLPFFRGHSATGTVRREPWSFGEPYTTIMRRFLTLRYHLLPYLYTLAWEASRSGHPLVRPLFWEFESDQPSSKVEDAFLLGNALLVAPVVEEHARTRQVVVPPGLWYHFWDDTPLEGPDMLTLEAPLERIPLLVRGGSVLPMETDGDLNLHIYPPHSHHNPDDLVNRLYTDAGEGYGESRLDRFQLHQEGQGLELIWEKEGSFPLPYRKLTLHLHGVQIHTAWVDGKFTPLEENRLQVPPFQRIRFEMET